MPTRRRALQFCLQGAGAAVFPPWAAAASEWPDRAVRIVVPNPPGGTADISARVVFERVGTAVKQSFIVENRAGGNGAIAMVAVARAKPDGYTFVVAGDSATYLPLVQQSPQFTMERDFTPVSLMVAQPVVIAVNPRAGIHSLGELVAQAKAAPDKFSYGVSGVGSTHHVAAEMFCEAAGIRMTAISYKGGGQAVTDLLSGQIPVACLGAGAVATHARNGRVKILAVTSGTRSSSLPEAPTLRELGVPGIDVTQWFALYAPDDTPADVVAELQRQVNVALKLTAVRKTLAENGIDAVGTDGATLAARQARDGATWLAAMRRLHITPAGS